MRVLGKKYPTMPALLIFSKEIKEGKITEFVPRVFKTDYKLMYQYAKERECIFFFAPDDYIYISKGKIIKQIGNGNARFVSKMLTPKYNPVETEFEQHFGNLKYYQHLYKKNKNFVKRVEYLFKNLETDVDLIYDIMKPRQVDIFIFKLMNVLQFLKNKDPMFIRRFKGNPNERYEGIDPEFEAKTLLSCLKEFTDIEFNLNDIYIEVEEHHMDEQFIQIAVNDDGENAPA